MSTPAALLNYLHAIDPERRRHADFLHDVKHVVMFLLASCSNVIINFVACLISYFVFLNCFLNNWQVFDEADMLLCGSFQNQVIRLINMFRFDEKLLSRAKNSPAEKPLDMEPESTMQSELEDREDILTNSISEDDEESEDGADVANSLEETEAVIKKRDWKRTREIYERSKQYIFVAATLPQNGKRTAGGELKRLFPDAIWVSGHYLHRHNPRCLANFPGKRCSLLFRVICI